MAYTRAWDETFPPDTQAANLLGADIRNKTQDIRERMASFGAGTLANRPAPEATFAGVMYFATDNATLYRWNGATWDVVGSIPPGGGTNGQFLRGDGVFTNVLLAALTVNSLSTAGGVTADNVSLTNGAGNQVTRGGESGSVMIADNGSNITFIYDTNLDFTGNKGFQVYRTGVRVGSIFI